MAQAAAGSMLPSMFAILRSPLTHGLAVFALCLAALGPAMGLLDLGSGAEGRIVAAAMTSDGEQEPLGFAERITRILLPAQAIHDLAATDATVRGAAFARLTWQARLPGLIMAGILLTAAYAMGRAMRDSTFGWMTALICGGSVLFLRYARSNTPDAYLAAVVTVANAAATCGIFRGGRWIAWPLWGLAAGAAAILGGGLAIVYTALPLVVFAGWLWLGATRTAETARSGSRLAIMVGVVLFLVLFGIAPCLCGLWTLAVGEAEAIPSEATLGSVRLVPLLLPWAIFLASGIIFALSHVFVSLKSKERSAAAPGGDKLASLLNFTAAGPIASAQALPYDRPAGIHRPHLEPSPHRLQMTWCVLLLCLGPAVLIPMGYRSPLIALPLLAPAAALAAYAIDHALRNKPRFSGGDRLLSALHWLIVATIGIGLPAVMASPLLNRSDYFSQPWFDSTQAAFFGGLSAVLLVVGIVLHRTSRLGMAAATFAVMILTNYGYLAGFRGALEGQSPMRTAADRIWEKRPSAEVYLSFIKDPAPSPVDLEIYTNRKVRVVPRTALPGLAEQASGTRPLVAIIHPRPGEAKPSAPAGWSVLSTPMASTDTQIYIYEAKKKPARSR